MSQDQKSELPTITLTPQEIVDLIEDTLDGDGVMLLIEKPESNPAK